MAGKKKAADVKVAQQKKKKCCGLKKVATLTAIALSVAAVVKEVRTPADERTWNGKVASVVPYDLRMPTIERAKERLWDPEATSFISPRVFGVGWTLNIGKVVAAIRERLDERASAA